MRSMGVLAEEAERPLEHRALGTRSYLEVLDLQRNSRSAVMTGDAGDVLFTVEHDPGVLTAGRRARAEHILAAPRELADYGVEMHAVERGGGWTWHGPGQLVAYPIVDLRARRLRVPDFVAGLEEAMVVLARSILSSASVPLGDGGLVVGRRCGFPGAWVREPGGELVKIGAVGVHVRRFVSMHGLALNLAPEPFGFDWIVACGLESERTTSLARLCARWGKDSPVLPSIHDLGGHLASLLPGCWASPGPVPSLVDCDAAT
ncbi:MAG TPA: lipoyl(octanoyl) transferase [Deltaproteobacteria bacterium]|nr:lipoyl(octanoyl) transferase [Deltaproteobacteria bacterium]